MEIPYERLSPDILKAVIEEFVLREGTEYGSVEFSLEQKVDSVRRQLRKGLVKIVFNPDDDSCSIVPAS
jgi:uncharacterized protein YheU (UPF0270 family)